jgi:RNase P/RNase MRP subunit p30
MVLKAAKLGYRLVAVTFPVDVLEAEIRSIKSVCEDAGIDCATRVDLTSRTPDQLKNTLRRVRRRYEVVSVLCYDKNVARQAAKDRRVDLLNFPSLDYRRRFFDIAEAELASTSLAMLEIDIVTLLVHQGAARIRLLSMLRREVTIARAFHIPIVISSGASEEILLREPSANIALASLFDLSEKEAVDAVSVNPLEMWKRNEAKLGSDFVAPGIRIVRKRDC